MQDLYQTHSKTTFLMRFKKNLSADSVIHIAMICSDLAKINCHMECICIWLPPPPPLFSPSLLLHQNRVQREVM